MFINQKSKIIYQGEEEAVLYAAREVQDEFLRYFRGTEASAASVLLEKDAALPSERFRLQAKDGNLHLAASDKRGLVYGLYYISRRFTGLPDFHFWLDFKPERKEKAAFPDDYMYESPAFRVTYRGWFINDEVLLSKWNYQHSSEAVWNEVFSTLLRCGGNMVIPGTDNNSRRFRRLAQSRGLIITQHHAEPLGAEMFSHAYPDLIPSYRQYPDKFYKLWEDAVKEQCEGEVIWNVGFRGQGDYPFWSDDPDYASDEARGRLISDIIRRQVDLLHHYQPRALTAVNLYGEVLDLYRKGVLDLPDDAIKIWADNGYGRMLTRRQGNHDPRLPALPEAGDKGPHGMYYHVSFYDLQAANHMTRLPVAPKRILKEIEEAYEAGIKDFWLINCSNVRPHVFYLAFIAALWRQPIGAKAFAERFFAAYFPGEALGKLLTSAEGYFSAAVSYGEHWDQKAGEQFVNHVPRALLTQYMKNSEEHARDLEWLVRAQSLEEQVRFFSEKAKEGARRYAAYYRQLLGHYAVLQKAENRRRFSDTFLLQAELYRLCYKGAYCAAEALSAAFAGDDPYAFYLAGKAAACYFKANRSMREREHGKWNGFYANDCLSDIELTGKLCRSFMRYLRTRSDGPDFYRWKREFLYSEDERKVLLLLNHEKHLSDAELFRLMEADYGETRPLALE